MVTRQTVTCSLKDDTYHGNCEQCNDREFCMLSEIIEKVRNLEEMVAQLNIK